MLNIKQKLFKSRYIILILIIAFIARIWGYNFGLPYTYNVDEPQFTNVAINFYSGDFNPHWFGHPGSFLMYLLFILYTIYFFIGLIMGHFIDLKSFVALFYDNPTYFYLIGRFTTVIFGTFSVYLLYKIVKIIFNEKIALIASIIFSVTKIHVFHSKIIRTDVTQTMLILLVLYYLIKYIDLLKLKYVIFSCMFTGFAIATKWPSSLLLIPIIITLISTEASTKTKINKVYVLVLMLFLLLVLIISIFLYVNKDTILLRLLVQFAISKEIGQYGLDKLTDVSDLLIVGCIIVSIVLLIFLILPVIKLKYSKNIRNIINICSNFTSNKLLPICLLVIFISFFIAAPFVVLNFGDAVKGMLIQAKVLDTHVGHDRVGTLGNILFFITQVFNSQFTGYIIELLSFVGIFFLFQNIKKLNTKHLILFVFPLTYFLAISTLPIHFNRYVIPIVPFFAILASVGLTYSVNIFKLKNKINNILLLIILLILLINPLKILIIDNYSLCQKNTRTLAKEWIEANLPENSYIACERFGPILHIQKRKNFRLLNKPPYIVLKSLNDYLKDKVDYIIITNRYQHRCFKDPTRCKTQIERYKELELKCKKIKIFKPKKFQPGPKISIYELPKNTLREE